MTTAKKLLGARLVAWAGFLFGTVVSVGFNVLAAFLVPEDAAAGWRPDVWTILGAAVWPLALLISIELLARVPWPETPMAKVIRYGAMTVVALFAAAISYQHIRSVLLAWRYNELSSGVGPLVIDGLMVLAGYAMVVISAVLAARQGGLLPEPKPDPVVPAETPKPETPATPVADAQPDWERTIVGLGKPLTVPLPQPREEARPVNGRRPVSAAAKPRAARAAAGPTVDEIVSKVVDRMAAGEQITKRVIAEEYGVGSGKANEALRRAREQHETTREEEQ
jgi:hypothetical protein